MACLQYVREKCGIQPKPKGERFTEADIERAVMQIAASRAKIVDSYHYVDLAGTVQYEVLRYQPKSFRQRRPDGNGGHVWNLNGVRRVLYRWPELAQHPSAVVYLTEGERIAASYGRSASSLRRCRAVNGLANVSKHSRAARSLFSKAHEAATLLHPVAASIKIVRFPSLPTGGDVSDWLDAGHRKDDLEDWCSSAPAWNPGEAIAPPTPTTGAEDGRDGSGAEGGTSGSHDHAQLLQRAGRGQAEAVADQECDRARRVFKLDRASRQR
jgi:hypothetical protein